jgi:hypothetical protein
MTNKRSIARAAAFAALLVVASLEGCGGGGGSSGTSNAAGSTPQTTPASPGTNASSTAASNAPAATVPQSTIPNVQPITVTSTPTQARNMLTTSVTVCAPNTSNCVTIDNVQVDTGSQGLRVLATHLPASLALPAVSTAANTNRVRGECGVFAGYTWGAVRTADVRMAGQLAPGIAIQVIGDPSVPTVPSETPPPACR